MKQPLIIGTKNQAKINQVRGVLKPLGLEVVGLPDINLPEIVEDGATAQDNARKKALAYAKILNQTVLSMDNGLYFHSLEAAQQPGIHVRRINKNTERPSDEELIKHYQDLITKLGSPTRGYWEFAFCLAEPNGTTRETTIKSERIFTSDRSAKIIPGYPLESLQINPQTNQHISEMTQAELDNLWLKDIGAPLQKFIREYLK